jgi:hypothetical protein
LICKPKEQSEIDVNVPTVRSQAEIVLELTINAKCRHRNHILIIGIFTFITNFQHCINERKSCIIVKFNRFIYTELVVFITAKTEQKTTGKKDSPDSGLNHRSN